MIEEYNQEETPENVDNDNMIDHQIPIVKMDELNRVVYGAVYSPDEVDAQNHFMKKPGIQLMAWDFMINLQDQKGGVDYMHNMMAGAAYVVESYISRQDEYEAGTLLWTAGSWILATKIVNDQIWQKILDGEITGYSIGASGTLTDRLKAKSGDKLEDSTNIPGVKYQ